MRKVIKRKRNYDTTETLAEKESKMSLGQPSRRMGESIGLCCIVCKTVFTKTEADKKHPKEFWRYSICSPECHIDLLDIPRDYRKVEIGSIEWAIYKRSFPDKVDEMDQWVASKSRKIISRTSTKRRIIKR